MTRVTKWIALYRRARAQGGLATLHDAVAVGIATSSFYGRVQSESWREVLAGTWLVPGAEVSERTRHWAAVLASGPETALSHETAAHLLDLRRRGQHEAIHVVRPYGLRADRVPGVVRHRSRRLDQRDLAAVDALPVTTAARTLIDIARSHAVWQLEAMMLAARQRRLLDVSALAEQHERRPGLPGAKAFLAATRLLAVDGADSILERRARKVLGEAGLHPTADPYPVRCEGATLHLDIAFPGHRFGIECDGFAHHGPGDHAVFERDRDRWRLLQQAGWRLTWLTWHRLHAQPGAFLAEVREAIAA